MPPDTGDTRAVLDGRGLDVPGLVRLTDAAAALPPGTEDRPFTGDVTTVTELLPARRLMRFFSTDGPSHGRNPQPPGRG
ncbi:hypothetical protein ACIPSA_43710 [Streptomyces sp. NPDC086549]|uniref:hypothetical protein n=1 Tax=Streptomyces sp. NPDC086549 TaxID=3365752 RepID=UPI0038135B62